MAERNIGQISNELEFNLDKIEAKELIGQVPNLVHEVNPRDIVELNVSLAEDIVDLNRKVDEDIRSLIRKTESRGGRIYGGASLLRDVSDVEPKWHRTTSMSESCGRGFLDITSQQIVLGVTDEDFGFELYRFLTQINPALLALSASSPLILREGELQDTHLASRRIEQYDQLCRFFPSDMWRSPPVISSVAEYFEALSRVSEKTKQMLRNMEMDTNWEELTRNRNNGNGGFRYYPFQILEPHQVYWFIRVRPDHRTIEKGGNSLFSLEVRVPDMSTSVSGIQTINSLVVGLSYYIADHGSSGIDVPLTQDFNDLRATGINGLSYRIGGVPLKKVVDILSRYAERGLTERGYSTEGAKLGERVENVLRNGNDSDLIRAYRPINPEQLKNYLVRRLKGE